MPLELLKVHNARNLKEYTLKPHPDFNIIFGSNGAGKTTILESVYLLLRSRIFRTNKFKSFINHEENTCTIFSKFSNLDDMHPDSFTIGISRSKDLTHPVIHLNSQKINSLSTITNLVVLGLITTESFTLLDSGPSIRRKFLDWGVFHVEHSFLSDWKAFKKIISSRNNLLSSYSKNYKLTGKISTSQRELINCWNPQLIALNNKLHTYRTNQLNNISTYFKDFLSKFSHTLSEQICLSYYKGWSNDCSYNDYLDKKIFEDLSAGFTRYGTHRSDLKIKIKKNMAKDILSRGQKKIVIICLILSQFKYLIEVDKFRIHNLLLLDDIDSELDSKNLEIVFTILRTLDCQILATTTNNHRYDFLNPSEHKLFHVEQSI